MRLYEGRTYIRIFKKDITTLVNAIAQLRAKPEVTEQDLLDLNTLIEEFHNHKHGSYNR